MCCLQGQIQLPLLQPLTGILYNYLTGDDYCSKEFHNNIWQYNVAFAMTSVGVKIDNSITRQSGPYCFKIQGELYHLTGALLPYGDQTPIYAQIYILDTAECCKMANMAKLFSFFSFSFSLLHRSVGEDVTQV